MPAPLTLWLVVLAAAFLVQALSWLWVAAGLRRVRADAALVGAASPTAGAGPLAVGGEQAKGTPSPGQAGSVALSVVVAAHNEAERLPTLLGALAAQTHRPFEVVVVDDRSADATAETVRQWARRFPAPLRLVSVAEGEPQAAGLPPKKHALERGAEAAAHGRLVHTDADGRPGPDWLATVDRWSALGGLEATAAPTSDAPAADLAAPGSLAQADRQPDGGEPGGASDGGAVLVGYGPYEPAPGWLNRFVRYETVQTAVLAAAAVGHGRPWHAVGRNLSVPAAVLEQLGGYAHSAGSLSGDDDLLVQEIARRDAAPVVYVWDATGAVPSPAPPDAAAFWRQKRRHASAGAHYPAGVLAALGLFHTSNLALWVGAPLAHLAGHPFGWGLLAGKLLLQRSVVLGALDDLGGEPDVRLWQPVLDALSAGYHAVLAVLGALPTPKRW